MEWIDHIPMTIRQAAIKRKTATGFTVSGGTEDARTDFIVFYKFKTPFSSGNLYIADYGNNRIRMVAGE